MRSDPGGRRAAFFDLDKTLIPGSSLFLLARGLRRRDFYGAKDMARFAWQQFAFRVGGSERAAGMRTSREAALEFVHGRHRGDVRAVATEISEELIVPRVYPDMADLIDEHRRAGDLTFIATAAPAELAEIVAERLGMSGALGTHAEVDDQERYNGRLAGSVLHGAAKAEAVFDHAVGSGIDLAASVAYSDSINDLPMLELVGSAQVVNPDRELRRVAAQRGWPVHELRAGRRRSRHGPDGPRRGPPRALHDRMSELGLPADAEHSATHRASLTVEDPDRLVEDLVATGRFHRDTRLGAIFHPGKVSLREISPTDSLHITLGPDNRVSAHVDRHSPLCQARRAGRYRYSPARIAMHNLSGFGANLLRMLPRRRRENTYQSREH
ncbi:MAG: HAD-IB family hydrolase [Actinomycetota bacterium]|nr:HAD-IB family hydrolase [Actinomycetota bacterium]